MQIFQYGRSQWKERKDFISAANPRDNRIETGALENKTSWHIRNFGTRSSICKGLRTIGATPIAARISRGIVSHSKSWTRNRMWRSDPGAWVRWEYKRMTFAWTLATERCSPAQYSPPLWEFDASIIDHVDIVFPSNGQFDYRSSDNIFLSCSSSDWLLWGDEADNLSKSSGPPSLTYSWPWRTVVQRKDIMEKLPTSVEWDLSTRNCRLYVYSWRCTEQ